MDYEGTHNVKILTENVTVVDELTSRQVGE